MTAKLSKAEAEEIIKEHNYALLCYEAAMTEMKRENYELANVLFNRFTCISSYDYIKEAYDVIK